MFLQNSSRGNLMFSLSPVEKGKGALGADLTIESGRSVEVEKVIIDELLKKHKDFFDIGILAVHDDKPGNLSFDACVDLNDKVVIRRMKAGPVPGASSRSGGKKGLVEKVKKAVSRTHRSAVSLTDEKEEKEEETAPDLGMEGGL